MMLVEAPSGSVVKVVALHGGRNVLAQLRDMGILEGTVIKVIRNAKIGPLIVEVNGTTFAIGRGMASKIEVELLSP